MSRFTLSTREIEMIRAQLARFLPRRLRWVRWESPGTQLSAALGAPHTQRLSVTVERRQTSSGRLIVLFTLECGRRRASHASLAKACDIFVERIRDAVTPSAPHGADSLTVAIARAVGVLADTPSHQDEKI